MSAVVAFLLGAGVRGRCLGQMSHVPPSKSVRYHTLAACQSTGLISPR